MMVYFGNQNNFIYLLMIMIFFDPPTHFQFKPEIIGFSSLEGKFLNFEVKLTESKSQSSKWKFIFTRQDIFALSNYVLK